MIGGDVFENRKHKLPESPRRTWYEAEFDYDGGYRNNCRLLYSNDGLLFVTYDHYMSFFEIGMNTITLDFSGIKSYWELHEYLKKIFQLPDYYGHNMDALWDCLYCCYDCSTTLVLKNLSAIPKELTPEIEIMLELLRDLVQKDGVNIIIEHAEASDISNYLI